jgi:hypothetical protein
MRAIKALVFAFLATAATGSTASAEIQLTIQDGRVSLIAKDATVRQILTEWARIGQTKVINVERITGGPVTLQLTNVSEEQALDVLLRSASGYMLAPRPTVAPNLSHIDRIIVMPTSVAPRTAVVAPTPAPVFQQPQFPQPVAAPGLLGLPGGATVPGVAEDDAADSRQAPTVAVPANRGPVFTFPQPQVLNPQGVPTGAPGVTGGVPAPQVVPVQLPTAGTPAPTTYPSTPTAPFGGVSVPGMVVPVPQPSLPGVIVPQPNGPQGP